MAIGKTRVADLNDLFADIFEQAMRKARSKGVMTALVTVYRDSIGTEDRVFSERPKAHSVKLDENESFQSPAKLGKTELARLSPGEAMSGATISLRDLRQDPEARTEAAFELGSALATTMEKDLLSVLPSLNGGAGATIGGAGVTLTWGHILAGQVQLHAKNVDGPYDCVLHPYAAYDLSSQVSLERDLGNVPDVVKNGLAAEMWLGRYQQTDFYVANDIEPDGQDDVIGAIFTADAIALDIRHAPEMFEPQFDQDAREFSLRMYTDYAYGVRRSTYGIPVKSDATAPVS